MATKGAISGAEEHRSATPISFMMGMSDKQGPGRGTQRAEEREDDLFFL